MCFQYAKHTASLLLCSDIAHHFIYAKKRDAIYALCFPVAFVLNVFAVTVLDNKHTVSI